MKRKTYYALTIIKQLRTGRYFATILRGEKKALQQVMFDLQFNSDNWFFDDDKLGKCVCVTMTNARSADMVMDLLFKWREQAQKEKTCLKIAHTAVIK